MRKLKSQQPPQIAPKVNNNSKKEMDPEQLEINSLTDDMRQTFERWLARNVGGTFQQWKKAREKLLNPKKDDNNADKNVERYAYVSSPQGAKLQTVKTK